MKHESRNHSWQFRDKKNSFICHSLVPFSHFFPILIHRSKMFCKISSMDVIRLVGMKISSWDLWGMRWASTLVIRLFIIRPKQRGGEKKEAPKPHRFNANSFYDSNCESGVFTAKRTPPYQKVLRLKKNWHGKIKRRILLFYYARCGLFPSPPPRYLAKWVSRWRGNNKRILSHTWRHPLIMVERLLHPTRRNRRTAKWKHLELTSRTFLEERKPSAHMSTSASVECTPREPIRFRVSLGRSELLRSWKAGRRKKSHLKSHHHDLFNGLRHSSLHLMGLRLL